MTTTQKITAAIAAKIAAGMSPMEALKAVVGADKVERMVSDLYDELRARA